MEVKPLSPKPFLALRLELKNLQIQKTNLRNKKSAFELELSETPKRLETRLFQLIPVKTENKNIISLLKTSIAKRNLEDVSFLGEIINQSFDSENLSFRDQYTLKRPIAMAFFAIDFAQLLKEFNRLEEFWKGQARITVTKDDMYHYFTFCRLG
jgi:hypothetical protein